MKSYDYNAVVYDGEIYCIGCLPPELMDEAAPIFAGHAWDIVPVCCRCGQEHDYVTLLTGP
jgi:hypothetical protein